MEKRFVMVLALAASIGSAAWSFAKDAEPGDAEYAVRWVVGEGGPATAKAALAALEPGREPKSEDMKTFEVDFFDVTKDLPDAPKGEFDRILRQRKNVSKNKTTITFKYRGDSPMDHWSCPIARHEDPTKQEVDVSFVPDGKTERKFSYSCDVEGLTAPPEDLGANHVGCKAKMTRFDATVGERTLRFEEWEIGTVVVVEVSESAKNTSDDEQRFRKHVVEKLLAAKITPSPIGNTSRTKGCTP